MPGRSPPPEPALARGEDRDHYPPSLPPEDLQADESEPAFSKHAANDATQTFSVDGVQVGASFMQAV